MIQIILSILILVFYIVALSCYGGRIPSSLSASVFYLPQKKRWIWSVFLFSVSFLTLPVLIESVSENTRFIAFLSISALAFVGAAPLEGSTTGISFKVHFISAYVCCIGSQLLIYFNSPWLLLFWVPWVITLVWFKCRGERWRTWSFWAEMVCFANPLVFCLISVLK